MITLARSPATAGFRRPFLAASRRCYASRRVVAMAAKRVLVPIGRGSEEMEAVRDHGWACNLAERQRRCQPCAEHFRQRMPARFATRSPWAFCLTPRPPPPALQVVTIDVLRRAGAEVGGRSHLARLPGPAPPVSGLPYQPLLWAPLPQVTVASVEDSLEVVCARQTKIVADKAIAECTGESWDLIALPVRPRSGGPMNCS